VRIGNARGEAVFEFIAQGADACRVFLEREAREFGGFAEADDAGNVFRTGAETALMVAAVKKLLQTRAAANVKRSDAFGAVEFVGGDGKKIDAESFYVERNFSGGLHGIGVEIDVTLRGEFSNLRERLHGAEFVVGVHDGDERGVRTKSFFDLLDRDDAVGIYGEIGDGDGVFFKRLASVEDGFVFDIGGDDVFGGAGRGADDSENGVIVGFCPATRKDDFLGTRAEKRGDLIAGGFDGGAGALANSVDRGGVAEVGGEIGKHRVEDGGFDGGGGVEIEVDAIHGVISRVERLSARVNSAAGQKRKKRVATEAQSPQRKERICGGGRTEEVSSSLAPREWAPGKE